MSIHKSLVFCKIENRNKNATEISARKTKSRMYCWNNECRLIVSLGILQSSLIIGPSRCSNQFKGASRHLASVIIDNYVFHTLVIYHLNVIISFRCHSRCGNKLMTERHKYVVACTKKMIWDHASTDISNLYDTLPDYHFSKLLNILLYTYYKLLNILNKLLNILRDEAQSETLDFQSTVHRRFNSQNNTNK